MALQVLFGHAERINADVHPALSVGKRRFNVTIDIVHISVGHRVATNRFAFPVDHQIGTGISLRFIVIIRETDIDGAIIFAVWLQMAGIDAIKTFRAFKIPFTALRAKPTGEVTDREAIHQAEFVAHLGVQLQLAFFFEYLDIDR
ncbi:hypothetical protein D3C79_532770 [compost metagenome]